jgi:transcriptional regulator with XRE-family HTH domain
MQKPKQPQPHMPNEQLREERQKRGWSRMYIAEQIGVADPKTVGRWERGSAFPSAHFLQKLCELFQMPAIKLGLWQCKEYGVNTTLGELKRWDEILGSDILFQENTEALARAIPVRIGTHTALLILNDPKAYVEQIIDVL